MEALNVAKYILWYANDKGDLITNKKLQKLLYYAQAWDLALHNKILFVDEIEAWVHGPVVPEVYHQYKRYGWGPLPPPKKEIGGMTQKAKDHIGEIMIVYGEHSADFLERLSHSEKPWIDARGDKQADSRSFDIISRKSMRDFYRAKLTKKNGKKK